MPCVAVDARNDRTMLSPTHEDVAPVLHLLDPCDVCGGDDPERYSGAGGGSWADPDGCPSCGYKPAGVECGWSYHGKALHPDRVVGALRRWLRAHLRWAVEKHDDASKLTVHRIDESGRHSAKPYPAEVNADTWIAFAYCRAARAVLEAASG